MKTIMPERAAELVKAGATLIDIRENNEYASENIPGARHHALSQIGPDSVLRAGDTVLIYHCKSGGRTTMNASRLAAAGEASVGALTEAVELSQSALSQHLAKMRDDGLVATRRDGQIIYYRIVDEHAGRLMALLKDIYCP